MTATKKTRAPKFVNLMKGDAIAQLKKLPDNSIDSIVTDPPYELRFMGKSWDASGITFTDILDGRGNSTGLRRVWGALHTFCTNLCRAPLRITGKHWVW
jgi:DNA modification methylase